MLFRNVVDACEIEAEILEVKSSAGVVVVGSFVPEWLMITGEWSDFSFSTSLRIVFTSSILGHLKYKNSCVGLKSFLVSIYVFPFESQRKTTVSYSRGSNCLAWEPDIIWFAFPWNDVCVMFYAHFRSSIGRRVSLTIWRSGNLFPVGMFGVTVMLVSILCVSWVWDFVLLSSVFPIELAFVTSISGASSSKQRVFLCIERVAILLLNNNSMSARWIWDGN